MNPEAFQAPTLEELQPLFPSYSIDAFIAQGGMGAVYLATQTSLEREVAIKILPRELGKDEEFRQSFAAEAKAMAKLNHPNLIGVYDFGEVDGMPFIVMEYVAGKPLHDSAYVKQIDPGEAARIVQETCLGLQHAHEHDILHRDVKPANILLDPHHAEAKLGDFGLAMAASEKNDDGLIFGTPGYAAPEVYEGNPDARSDVYAAAVILYQLLTGQLPGDPYQHPSALANCDRRFDSLLAKALQPKPNDRHQSAAEFASELDNIRKKPAPVTVAASAAQPVRPVAPLASAKKGSGGAIIFSFIALAAVVGAAVFFLGGNKEQANQAKEEITEASDTQPNTPPKTDKKNHQEELAAKEKEKERETRLLEKQRKQEERQLQKDNAEKASEKRMAAAEKSEPEANEAPIVQEEASPVSTFDHLGFLARGRNYCVKNAERTLAEYQENLIRNIEKLEREGKSILRDEDYLTRDSERARKGNLELTIKDFQEQGRLPDNLKDDVPESLSQLTYREGVVAMAIREAMDEQEQIEQQLAEDLEPLTESYVNGVRAQAEKLQQEGNLIDARILTEEADFAENSFAYFKKIVRNENPLPPSLAADPANQTLEQLVVGTWQLEDEETTFFIMDDQTAVSRSPEKEGSWQSTGESIIINWGGHTDLITFEEGEYHQFQCYNSKVERSFTFLREGGEDSDHRNEEELSEEVDPIVGDWLRDDETKKSLYTFLPDQTILQDDGIARGRWEKIRNGGYNVHWGNGAVLRIQMRLARGLLIINKGQFELNRYQDPLVGEWVLENGNSPGVVFTFKNDRNADNGIWNTEGKWTRKNDAYRVTWNGGKWIDLKFEEEDILETVNSDGSRKKLRRK